MSRSTRFGPGGNRTTNVSNYFFNKHNVGGIGASSISNRRAKNRFAGAVLSSTNNSNNSNSNNICASLVVGNDPTISININGMTLITFINSNNDDDYSYLPFTGMDFYFFGTNYGNSDGTNPSTSIYMSTNNAFGFGQGFSDFENWSQSNPAILFDFFDSYNFASYVSPPQNGTITGVKYVRIVTTGTDINSSNDPTIKKAYEIYYVRDNCFQYMQFNCFFEGGFNRSSFNSNLGNISNITDGTSFQNTFGPFGDYPQNNEGPQTDGSYVIRSDLNGNNWQFFPNTHLVL